ncbi:unnamed protein product [Amoebophrya sp. A25]|nr:unnamed protein product [Amoebophrya sp. A25]|eukprot:GSA25T00006322001.1
MFVDVVRIHQCTVCHFPCYFVRRGFLNDRVFFFLRMLYLAFITRFFTAKKMSSIPQKSILALAAFSTIVVGQEPAPQTPNLRGSASTAFLEEKVDHQQKQAVDRKRQSTMEQKKVEEKNHKHTEKKVEEGAIQAAGKALGNAFARTFQPPPPRSRNNGQDPTKERGPQVGAMLYATSTSTCLHYIHVVV